jgi:PPOX class probable F420-dependent enzyme
MTRLSAEQSSRLQDFLTPSRIAVVATVGSTGMPQLTPNWYVWADGRLAMSTTKERFKYRNLSRDSRLSVCIYSEPGAQDYVVLTGRAEVSDDESIWPVTRAIVERYVARDQVAARMTELRTQNRVIISLTPERVVFRD